MNAKIAFLAASVALSGSGHTRMNYAADGGIYPELLANRGFDWKTKDLEGWESGLKIDFVPNS